MSPIHRLHPADYPVMPWKDGGGTTTQIAIEPPHLSLADPFLWRLSSARVARSGPFSRFPGYRRILALVEGPGLDLAFEDGTTARLEDPAQPVAFDGALGVQATLRGGPCVDLGLIYDPSRVTGALKLLRLGTDPLGIDFPEGTLLIAPEGGLQADGIELASWAGLRLQGARRLSLRALGRPRWLAEVRLRPEEGPGHRAE